MTGKRIVVTRAAHQSGEMESLLREHGAEPVLYPCIEIAPPEELAKLDGALRDAVSGDYDWLVLTSANTVLILKQRLDALGLRLPDSLKVAAVGPSTAAAARADLGVEVSSVPEKYVAESLAETLAPKSGTRILLPQAEIARPMLAQGLIASRAAVKAVHAYRTILGSGGADVPNLLAQQQIDAITFTSASTARNFVMRLLDEGGDLDDCDGVCTACIGPDTADAVREVGLRVDVLPEKHTLKGLIGGLVDYYSLQAR